ncbi:MAG: hypothetical protein LBG95_02745 [Treponema sp.]|jgi:predicted LPLAT superfamily acyltransferase|nr:hypothetical protein [Treponema sp.]
MEEAPLHWSQQKEKAAGYWQVKFLHILFAIFPVVFLRLIAFPVGFFYFLFSKKARNESRRFLEKAAPLISDPAVQKKCRSPFGALRHITAFSLTLIEKIETWGGKFPLKSICFQDDDIGKLIDDMENGRGMFVFASHLGNIELLRGLASFSRTGVARKVPVTAIFDMKVNKHFTRMINELNPESSLDIISAQDIGPHTAALLEEKLAAGEMITSTGDRTSSGRTTRDFIIPFLETEALFSSGVFYLAALTGAPVYFIFALRQKDLCLAPKYDMHVHKSPLSFGGGRKERNGQVSELAHSYAALLESYCKEKPFQWYNFYDFWSKEA